MTSNAKCLMTTEKKPPKTQTVGSVLRMGREKKGLSRLQLSRQLRLPTTVVDYIENDQLDRLAPIYRRGYIRNYARQVDLDERAVLSLIPAAEGNEPQLQEVLPTPRHNAGFEQALRGASYLLVTAVIVLPLVWMFVESGARFFEPSEEKEVHEITQESEEPLAESDNGNDSNSGPVSQRLAHALFLDESASQPTHLTASAIPMRSRSSDDPPSSDEAGSPLFELSGPISAAVADSPTPIMPRENLVELELEEDSWVDIRDANGVRIAYDLAEAGHHRFEGEAPFTVLLGRAASARVSIDGVQVDISKTIDGDVARFELASGGEILY